MEKKRESLGALPEVGSGIVQVARGCLTTNVSNLPGRVRLVHESVQFEPGLSSSSRNMNGSENPRITC
jgi:hypothetical protein